MDFEAANLRVGRGAAGAAGDPAPLEARLARGLELVPPVADRSFSGALRLDRRWVAARAVSDILLLAVATALSGIASGEVLGAWSLLGSAATLAGFSASGLYLPRLRLQLLDELRRLLTISALATLAVAAVALLVSDRGGIGDATVVHWLLASALLSSGRLGLYGAQRAARPRPEGGRRTLIIGAGNVGQLAAKRLLDDPQLGLWPVGFLDKEPLPGVPDHKEIEALGLPVLGASWDLEQVIATHRIEQVVVAFSTAPHEVMLNLVRRCWTLEVGVMVIPRLFEVEGRRVRVAHLGGLPLVALHTSDPRGWQFAVKYALDRALAAAALLALSPLLAAIALATLLTMGRPILFRQRRVGRDGSMFDMLKFRTMHGAPALDGEGDAGWAALVLADPRVEPETIAAPDAAPQDRRTPIGAILRRFSLDELPQLWNVVRGDMSLIGPRPERNHYVERFQDAVYRYPERHRVKSGLTGWAQVNGLRGETSLADRIEWDNFYIENWSPWLDLRIMLKTVPAIFGRRN